MIRITLSELTAAKESIEKLMDQDLPARISFGIRKGIEKINAELKVCDEERVKLIKKYGNEENKMFRVSDENMENFTKEYGDLLSTEVEIDFTPIKLEFIENVKLSTRDMMRLGKLIEE